MRPRPAALLAIVLMALPAVDGCIRRGETRPSEDVPFSDIARGAVSGIHERMTIAVRDEPHWESLWALHTRGTEPPPEPPAVDFEREIVIAIFKGESPDGCHATVIDRITHFRDEQRVVVEGRWIEGSSGASCTQQITHPFHIVRAKRATEDEVRFRIAAVYPPA